MNDLEQRAREWVRHCERELAMTECRLRVNTVLVWFLGTAIVTLALLALAELALGW